MRMQITTYREYHGWQHESWLQSASIKHISAGCSLAVAAKTLDLAYRVVAALHTSYESGCAVLPLLVMEPPLEPPVLFASAWIVLVLRWRKAIGARLF